MEHNDLKEYLKNVYEIEKIIYEEEWTKKLLLHKINKPVKYHKITPVAKKTYSQSEDEIIFGLGCWGLALGAIICGAIVNKLVLWLIAIMVAGICGFLGIIIMSSATTTASIEEKEREKAEKIMQENEIAKKKNEVIKINAERNRVSAETQLKLVEVALVESKKIREKIYLLDVIHSKYRNLAAISSIYEYIDTGICYELTGPQGAYDRYELMIRLGKINANLEVIIDQLESIKETQELLYYAMNESIDLSKRMLAGFQKTEQRLIETNKSLKNIEEYQSQSIEYNKITASNSEFLKWYTVFKDKL